MTKVKSEAQMNMDKKVALEYLPHISEEYLLTLIKKENYFDVSYEVRDLYVCIYVLSSCMETDTYIFGVGMHIRDGSHRILLHKQWAIDEAIRCEKDPFNEKFYPSYSWSRYWSSHLDILHKLKDDPTYKKGASNNYKEIIFMLSEIGKLKGFNIYLMFNNMCAMPQLDTTLREANANKGILSMLNPASNVIHMIDIQSACPQNIIFDGEGIPIYEAENMYQKYIHRQQYSN